MGIHGVGQASRESREARERAEAAAKALARSRLYERTCHSHNGHSNPPVDAFTSGVSPPQDQLPKSQLSRRCKEKMLMNGWCCHQVNHLSRVHSLETLSYLGTLKRSSHRLADHKHCQHHEACVAYNVDGASYKTRHVDINCSCTMVWIPYSHITKIIRDGGIPLISIERNDWTDTSYELRVYPRTRKSKYIAVSHIWSDGLGNPHKNALPLCQIKRLKANLLALKNVFEDFDGPTLFWMDTLCIPVGLEEQSLRLVQIHKMASIYKGAISSLVLDAELTATKINVVSSPRLSVELRARIACSTWMCRSWTLQEGRLPPTITIQFLDNAIVLGRSSKEDGLYLERATTVRVPTSMLPIEDSGTPLEANMSVSQDVELRTLENRIIPIATFFGRIFRGTAWDVRDFYANRLENLRRYRSEEEHECDCIDIALQRTFFSTFFKDSVGNKATQFVSVWNELAGRSTTKPNDLFLIIANILELDTRGLRQYEAAEEVFQTIILSLGKVPLSLFFNTGPRQDKNESHQNRWVPLKISTDILTPDHLLTISSSHLSYKYMDQKRDEGITIFTINGILPLKSKLYLRSEEGEILYVVEPSNSSVDRFNTEGFSSTCIVVENMESSDGSGTKRGACFYVRDNHDNRSWWHQALQTLRFRLKRIAPPVVDMTFICPIQLQQVVQIQALSLNPNHIYSLSFVKPPCEFRIRYDPLPRFKPLVERKPGDVFIPDFDTVFYDAFRLGTMLSLVLCLGMGAAFGGRVWIMVNPISVIGIGAIFAVIISVALVAVNKALIELDDWMYVRSFEDIASSRPPKGVV